MSKITNYEQALEKAFWLLRHTTLTFYQIADFCELDPLEVAHIENKSHNMHKAGFNPILYQEITQEDIQRCEADSSARLPKSVIEIKKSKKKISTASLEKQNQRALNKAIKLAKTKAKTEKAAMLAEKTKKKAEKDSNIMKDTKEKTKIVKKKKPAKVTSKTNTKTKPIKPAAKTKTKTKKITVKTAEAKEKTAPSIKKTTVKKPSVKAKATKVVENTTKPAVKAKKKTATVKTSKPKTVKVAK